MARKRAPKSRTLTPQQKAARTRAEKRKRERPRERSRLVQLGFPDPGPLVQTLREALAPEEGDIVAIGIAVFRPRSVPADRWDSEGVVNRVASALLDALGRRATGEVDLSINPFGLAWRATVPLSRKVPAPALAPVFRRVEREIDLEGGTVHFGLVTDEGEYLPASYAFETAEEALDMAEDECLSDIARYRTKREEAAA